MKNDVRRIQFEGGELLGVKADDGKVYLAIKKACLDIGLNEIQAKHQVESVQTDVVLSPNCREFPTVQKEGKRDVNRKILCIEESFVTLWLAKITLTPTMQTRNPEAVKKLKAYQIKAAAVLHDAFMATEEQKQEFYDELGLKGQIIELEHAVTDMKTTMDRFIDSSTINSRQAQKILHAGKDRVNYLLGSARSDEYKRHARVYFKNMWNQFAEAFGVTTYKDLSPINMNDGYDFISKWNYAEN